MNTRITRSIIAPTLTDPFARASMRPLRMHPRRDPDGHPDGGNGGGGDNPPNDQGGNNTPDPNAEWASLFDGMSPAEVKSKLDNSRKWETRSKENFDDAEKFRAFKKQFGEGGDTPPDPEKLKGDLTAAQREARESKIELAVLRKAGNEIDGARLLDSRRFMAKLDELDPADSEFATKVADFVKKAAEDDPSLLTVKTPRPNRQQGNPSQGRETSLSAGRERWQNKHGNKSQ